MSQKKLSRVPPGRPCDAQQPRQAFDITVLPQRPECPGCQRLYARIQELESRLLVKDDQIRQLQDDLSMARLRFERLESKTKIPPVLGQIPQMPKSQFAVPPSPAAQLQYSEPFDSQMISFRSQSISTSQKLLAFTFQLQLPPVSAEPMDRLETLYNAYLDLYNDPMFIQVQNLVMDGKSVFFVAVAKRIVQVARSLAELEVQQDGGAYQFFALVFESHDRLDLTGRGFSSIYIDGKYESVSLGGNYGQVTLFGCKEAEISVFCKGGCQVDDDCLVRWV